MNSHAHAAAPAPLALVRKAGRPVEEKDPLWNGCKRRGQRIQITLSQGRGQLEYHSLPAGPDERATLRALQQWKVDRAAELNVSRKQRATQGEFEFDARKYLKDSTVRRLSTYTERVFEIGLWVLEFQGWQRSDIKKNHIADVKNRWATEPREKGQAKVEAASRWAIKFLAELDLKKHVALPRKKNRHLPLAGATVDKRHRALANLFTVLDPKGSANPAHEVAEEPKKKGDPLGRAIPYPVIEKLIAAMPDQGRAKKGEKRPTFSKTKILIRCLSYCQLTECQLMEMTDEHFKHLDQGEVMLPARHKGEGASWILSPVSQKAAAAFRDFQKHKLYGSFSESSVWKCWNRAAKKLGLPPIRVYDLRHSVATMISTLSKDDRASQYLLQHGQLTTTHGYTQGGVPERVREAVAKYDAYLESL